MELRNLKTFQVVADQLNLSKAAEILSYTQPTISVQIQALERELGHPLFNRVGKKTFLTPTGKLVKHHTDIILNAITDLETALKTLDEPYGKLAIAAPEYYYGRHLSLLISSFIKDHPKVKLDLACYNSKETIKLVSSHQADIGIIAGKYNSSEMESINLDTEEVMMVTTQEISEQYDLSTVFSHYPLITYRESCNLEDVIKGCLSELQYQPTNIIESGSDEAIKRSALNQTSIALLSSDGIKEELATGKLVPIHRFQHRVETSLIYLKSRSEEANIQSFCDLLKQAWKPLED
ncbi:cysJI operon transcriptional regulator CysL [Paenibacillus elgii]|uniref:LysR family transcriptional regulator n=1 Tax=Paenibacillus elgii TaxID=189691 RepID=UPI002D7A7FAF|nr:cysJI operon transcriptional regulator CysL [Paenibacillus elgii]